MRLKLKGTYFPPTDGTPAEISRIVYSERELKLALYDDAGHEKILSGYQPDDFEVEGGEPEKAPPTPEEQAQAAAVLTARTLGLAPDIEAQAAAMQVIVEAAGLAGDTSPDGDWQPDEYVAVGDKRSYNGQKYICRQAHVTKADWAPDVVAALWEVERSGGQWQQPAPGTHGYRKGDIVTHGGKTWISDVDYNVWEPGAAGVYTWVEVAG